MLTTLFCNGDAANACMWLRIIVAMQIILMILLMMEK